MSGIANRLGHLLGLLALATVVSAAAPEPETTTIVVEEINGTYTDLGGELREVRNGPVVVRPTSENNTFELFANRLELTPLEDGEHQADLWVHFEGEADVEAEILVAGISGGTLTDVVVVPNQERTIRTRVKLERQEEKYLITMVESEELTIQIESQLAGQLVTICENFTRFTFGSSCDGLDTALNNPRVPMPEPGKELELDARQLSPEQKRQLDDYLERSGSS